ncbi:PH domain-containing protein [Halovivax sp.]|uniref:PH domain-containing protein n=1 Tax=Halovivax sp. TaxID=1935978 RepID=UPI0025B8A73B|nr:PH domain-containing protein [Halovivax sp.]
MNRLHPLSAVSGAINRGILGFFVPFFLVSVVGGALEEVHPAMGLILGAIGFFAGVGYAIAYYYRFEYGLAEDTFDIASGVIARRSREIPYRRIQNVDISQNVLFQLLGLARVSIETAGGGGTEASLNFVSEDEATRLQREIRRMTAAVNGERRGRRPSPDVVPTGEDGPTTANGTAGEAGGTESSAGAARRETLGEASGREPSPASGDGPAADERTVDAREGDGDPPQRAVPDDGRAADDGVDSEFARASDDPTAAGRVDSGLSGRFRTRRLFELSSRELLLYSFASFRPAALAAVGFLVLFATDFLIQYLVTAAQPVGGPAAIGDGTTGSYAVLGVVSMIHAVILTYFVSILYTFFAYYGFRLGQTGDDLVYERGLLQRYSGSIPLEKVQSVTVTDNPIQRRIDHAGLWVETAGYGPESNGGSQSAVPLARVPRVHNFAERLTDLEAPLFERPTTVARRRYLARYSILATVLVVAAYGLSLITPLSSWYLAGATYLLVPPAAHLRWHHLGYYVGEGNLVIREGFWSRKTTVIPYYRVQTVSTRRSIFQRRLGLASLVVDTASSRTYFWSTPTIHDVDVAIAREINDASRERLQTALEERSQDGGSTPSL